jgi:hypothetical protein
MLSTGIPVLDAIFAAIGMGVTATSAVATLTPRGSKVNSLVKKAGFDVKNVVTPDPTADDCNVTIIVKCKKCPPCPPPDCSQCPNDCSKCDPDCTKCPDKCDCNKHCMSDCVQACNDLCKDLVGPEKAACIKACKDQCKITCKDKCGDCGCDDNSDEASRALLDNVMKMTPPPPPKKKP